MDLKNMKLYVGNESYLIVDQYQKKTRVFMLKMLTIIMILMLIEYYYTKKARMNTLLDIDIQIRWILYHYN